MIRDWKIYVGAAVTSIVLVGFSVWMSQRLNAADDAREAHKGIITQSFNKLGDDLELFVTISDFEGANKLCKMDDIVPGELLHVSPDVTGLDCEIGARPETNGKLAAPTFRLRYYEKGRLVGEEWVNVIDHPTLTRGNIEFRDLK